MSVTFPNESAAYRAARDELVAAEAALRNQVEAVAAQRRSLPTGGGIPEDYVFQSADGEVKLSELFEPDRRPTLALYSYMYGPEDKAPCPYCTSFLDSLDGAAPHLDQEISLAVTISGPVAKADAIANARGWSNLRMLSAQGTSYNRDYHGETADGGQMPMMNIFQKTNDGIKHHWGSELMFYKAEEGQNGRHIDMMWPLWNVLDLTPDGRGEGNLKLSYD